MKVANTAQLLALAQKAIDHDFNRQLHIPALQDRLDPEGVHVVSFYMPHKHKQGELTDDEHLRCVWQLKCKNMALPVDAVMDVAVADFQALPDHEEVVNQ